MKMLAIVSALVTIGFITKPAHASDVTVSSSTVTTVIGSDSGRANLWLFNNGAGNLYYSKTSAGATVASGMILLPATGVELTGYKGTVYGLAAANASDDVRYFSISR